MQLAVVVPTRNRAALAPFTIQSILDAGDDRVRVVVSDNSTDAGQVEQLRAACAALPQDRVRLIRPDEGLPMTAHWEWALERTLEDPATTHVLYLSDRRVLRPGALAEVRAVIERHPGAVLSFGDDVIVNDEQVPVRVADRPWTGRLLRVDAAQLLRVSARGMHHVALPRMLNTIAPRTALEDLARIYGNVFASIAPDHCFAYRLLDRVDAILHLDRALVVQRAMDRSNGYSQIRGIVNADNADFMRELRGSRINQHAPVPELLTVTNAAYNEYEYVRAEPSTSKLAKPPAHFYLGSNARDVGLLQDPELRARMEVVLSAHGWSPRVRARYLFALAASAAGAYLPRPRALVGHLRRRPPAPAEFPDAATAVRYALDQPGAATTDAHHLWPLMSRPGAVRVLTAGPAAPAS